ncbi:hypothetical protein OGM63_04770 [Plectonema radiosum NIES-515]|uniref:Uncharacterized protein n=1 Tax=Plectonema radiosum NIES-515 TaxID=2986073 RepID=A0ABT3AUY2_9CYAN|nr:hypothetical protein [Plectonema radiosum]MCV3212845.1 hypothetical protein [Plectonema radiosum NIES-515]
MNISQPNVSLSYRLRYFKYLELDKVFDSSILYHVRLINSNKNVATVVETFHWNVFTGTSLLERLYWNVFTIVSNLPDIILERIPLNLQALK